MPPGTFAATVRTMDARTVDDAGTRLRELRREEWQDLGLAALALGLAVVATQASHSLALPLFVGGVAVAALGVRAVWRRWDLVDRLAGERDAYVLPDVLAYASREAAPERRHAYAAQIRGALAEPGPGLEARVAAAAGELEALAADLDDPGLALDPQFAVACMRLLVDPEGSPLLNRAVPPEELRSRVRRIRAGFAPR
jgi:hypothetical protein